MHRKLLPSFFIRIIIVTLSGLIMMLIAPAILAFLVSGQPASAQGKVVDTPLPPATQAITQISEFSFAGKALASTIPKKLVFEDNFETDKGWTMFEEIVGGNPCYGDGIGEVIRTTDVAYDGSYSLRVWANKAKSDKSNHVIGQQQIYNLNQTGIFHYEVKVYIASDTADTGQTGPEFSMQNTRKKGENQYRTSTAGIQYLANPYLPPGRWAIWTEVAEGVANWQEFTTQKLDAGKWYTMSVTANYDTNRYVQFTIQGDTVDVSIDLSAYRIAEENKFTEEAFWITLESENLWDCGGTGMFDYKVYYDQVELYQHFERFLPIILVKN